jgi:two-component system invasion response regulator UvrY
MTPVNKYKVGFADDHTLLRETLSRLINSFSDFEVSFQVADGHGVIERLTSGMVPQLLLVDIVMPNLNGFDTVLWVRKNYPAVKVLALSAYSDKFSIIKMFKCGANGYMMKNVGPEELKHAFYTIISGGAYISDVVTGRVIDELKELGSPGHFSFDEREMTFLELLATEYSYKEIAQRMNISLRTVDDYKKNLNGKSETKTRTGLVLFAIRNNLISVHKE